MRKTLVIGGVVLALLGLGIFLALPNADRFREPIQSALEKQLKRPVKLGSLGLSLWPLAVRVNDVTVGESASFGGTAPFVTARELYVRADLMGLLRGRVEIASLLIRGATVELRKNAEGKWNFSDLAAGNKEPASSGPGISLQELTLERFLLGVSSPEHTEYGPLDLTLRTRGPASYRLEAHLASGTMLPAPLEMTTDLDTPEGLVRLTNLRLKLAGLAMNGTAALDSRSTPARVEAELNSGETDLAEVLKPFKTGLKGRGRITASVKVSGTTAEPVVSGTASLKAAVIETPELTRPVEVREAQVRFSQKEASISGLDATLGSSQMRGTVAVSSFEPVTLAFDLSADKFDADEMRKLVVEQKAPASAKKPTTLQGSGKLAVAKFTGGGVTMENLKAQCALSGGELRLDPVSADMFHGQARGRITAPLSAAQRPVQLQLQVTKLDAGDLLDSTTSLKSILSGTLSGDSELSLTPGADVARGLNGRLKFDLSGGRLKGVQLMNEMAALARFSNFNKAAEPFTSISRLGGVLTIQNGVASTEDLSLAFDGGALTASGTVGLADRKLSLKLTTTLTPAVAAQFGGSQAAGLMNTFLQNAKGEIVIPATVSGTVDQPRFAPDAGRMAQMKLMPLFQGKQPQQVLDDVKGMFDTFRKKK